MKIKSIDRINWFAGTSLVAVFILDTITPTTYIVDILYLCCILFVFKERTSTIITFSIMAILLIVFNVLVEHKSELNNADWVNRGISIFAIGITSYISFHYRKINKEAQLKQQQHLKSLEEMLFMVSHQVRSPLSSILGIIQTIQDEEEELSTQDLKTRCEYLYVSANALDDFIKELNDFMHKAEKETQD